MLEFSTVTLGPYASQSIRYSSLPFLPLEFNMDLTKSASCPSISRRGVGVAGGRLVARRPGTTAFKWEI